MDDQDRPIPHQKVQSVTSTGRVRLSFWADLPALGYRTYRLLPQGTPVEATPVQASDAVLENERLRLEFDPETGQITSLYDTQAEVEVFSGPAARPVVIDDPSDTWGHNIFKFDREIGEFKVTSVWLVEHGPVKPVIRVTSVYGSSTLTQDFALPLGRDHIDVSAVVNWLRLHRSHR